MISRIYLLALFTCMLSLVEPGKTGKKKVHLSRNEKTCRKFAMLSYFDPELVVGPEWRIYYTWNTRRKSNCLGMKFYNINPWIVHRFWMDMGQYLAKQPLWSAAILYVTVGAAKHQMLLLADYGPAGRLIGVPNLIRDPVFNQHKRKKSVPLMRFQMKLLRGGKYLIIMDCLGGEIALSTRYNPKEPPYRAEIELVAQRLGFGRGSFACKTLRD